MNDDLISRFDAIAELDHVYGRLENIDMSGSELSDELEDIILGLPTVQPKTAYWIDVFGDVPIYNAGGFTEKRKIGVKCSNCQRLNTWCEFDYCPHCGAKMKGETE